MAAPATISQIPATLIVTPPLELAMENVKPPMPPQQQLLYVESIPSNWDIKSENDGEKIIAKNIVTGAIFEGTSKGFKRRLRGTE